MRPHRIAGKHIVSRIHTAAKSLSQIVIHFLGIPSKLAEHTAKHRVRFTFYRVDIVLFGQLYSDLANLIPFIVFAQRVAHKHAKG
ncbi:hypothetical protein D3C81_1355760 [compost metagenome]